MENFLARAKALLNERNHAVLMTGVTLLTEMCKQDPSVLSSIKEVLLSQIFVFSHTHFW